MNWTTEYPKCSNEFHWFRGKVKNYHGYWDKTTGSIIVSVATDFAMPRGYLIGTDGSVCFADFDGEWYGPIEMPV